MPEEQERKIDVGLQKIRRESEERETMAQARQLNVGYIDVSNFPIAVDVASILTAQEAKDGMIIPFFGSGRKIKVAVLDPENPETKAILEKLKKDEYEVGISVASVSSIEEALHIYDDLVLEKEDEENMVVEDDQVAQIEKEVVDLAALQDKLKGETSARALLLILVGAAVVKASDIHMEAGEKEARLRLRIDGVLQDVFHLDQTTFGHVVDQLKYQAGMKLNVRNIPQDGRISFRVGEHKIDVRVSLMPSMHGETIVMRLLDSGKTMLTLDDLGMDGKVLEQFREVIRHPYGLILVTGPTGSGKTTTLYAALREISTLENKIITLEDPIEYEISGIEQSQVEEEEGYNFADGLRAILRQDPDGVMVGEIRDLETAQIAAQASLTGHIVLSTLHTNTAVASIPRLVNMGLASYILAPAMTAVLGQRLVRKICPKCAKQRDWQPKEKTGLEAFIAKIKEIRPDIELKMPEKALEATGCPQCNNTGYKGRIGIYEFFLVTKEISEMILSGASENQILTAARKNGMLTMLEDGIIKVLRGVTILTEVYRVSI